MALFDAYVMVDWSAAATPRQGSDSIWISLAARGPGGVIEQALLNPPTRSQAVDWLADRLCDLAAQGKTTLLGFDFNFGFPKGFAARVTQAGDTPKAWAANLAAPRRPGHRRRRQCQQPFCRRHHLEPPGLGARLPLLGRPRRRPWADAGTDQAGGLCRRPS